MSRKSPFSLLRTPQFPRFSSSLFMTMRILSGIQVFPPQLFDFHPILGESRQKMPPKCRRRRPSRVASDGFRFSDWPRRISHPEIVPSGPIDHMARGGTLMSANQILFMWSRELRRSRPSEGGRGNPVRLRRTSGGASQLVVQNPVGARWGFRGTREERLRVPS